MIFEAKFEAFLMLALVDDFRTLKWLESVPYPDLVYQKTQKFLQMFN
jgi:hypothetical protein